MSDLRIDVADLLRHPGARRDLRRSVAVNGLGTSTARVVGPVGLDLVLERVSEGIVVRGTIAARFEAECGVCLREVAADVEVAVSELYEDDPVDGETYPLLGHVVDLGQLVRDAVLLELPLAPTCASTGGDACSPEPVDLDLGDDEYADAPVDPRWAALSELEL
jgi:uncharacterized protein